MLFSAIRAARGHLGMSLPDDSHYVMAAYVRGIRLPEGELHRHTDRANAEAGQ
jgi:hypothetical protein